MPHHAVLIAQGRLRLIPYLHTAVALDPNPKPQHLEPNLGHCTLPPTSHSGETKVQFVSGKNNKQHDHHRNATGEMDSQVAAFFTTYYMLVSMVLLNVVIAVLLDEFQTFVVFQRKRGGSR